MNITRLQIPDVLLITPKVHADERGYFFESFNQSVFNAAVGHDVNFVQDNHSKSKRGVLRGLHFQTHPMEQGKLVRVVQGEVFDVAVDIRPGSDTYGKWIAERLSCENKNQLWIPPGFAHGFLTISETTEFVYKTTNFYSAKHEAAIRWDDEFLAIGWPSVEGEKNVSPKDMQALGFSEFEAAGLTTI